MATALRPLQTAIFAALTASADLMTKVSGVYDEVPEAAAFPYVSLGSITELPADAHDRQGLDAMVTVHVWSKAPGFGEAYDIFAAIDAALDRVSLAVAGFTDVSIRHDQHQALKDPDPTIRHINAQYSVWLTRAS